MKIAGLQKVSLIDYPGCIAATVFLAGCNLNCGYCHNRWLLDASQVHAALSPQDLVSWLGTRLGRLDGVCFSGGEPTLHVELVDLLTAIKALGLAVKLDTNGTWPERLGALVEKGLVDYAAMDLKAPLDERYHAVAGVPVDVQAIRHSMALLRSGRCQYEFRTTVLPSLDMLALEDIAAEIGPGERWYLQRFVSYPGLDPALFQSPAPDEQALQSMAEQLVTLVPGIRVRGSE